MLFENNQYTKNSWPTFHWQGKNPQGQIVQGYRIARCAASLKKELRDQGITPLQVQLNKSKFSVFRQNIKFNVITLLLRQLATLLTAGIPLITALDSLLNNQISTTSRQLIDQIKRDICSGLSLAQAMSKHSIYFDQLTCALITAGEITGQLDLMLQRIVLHREMLDGIKNKLIKILIYPCTVFAIAMIITLILLTIVIPQFKNLFANYNAPLPAITRIVISVSQFLQNYGFIALLIFFSFIILMIILSKNSQEFAQFCQNILLDLPYFGSTLQKSILSRISRTLATTLSAGLPLLDSLHIAANVSGHLRYFNAMTTITQDISSGQSLHTAMETTGLFPAFMTQMITIGEESGTLDNMLNKVADWYDEQFDQIVARFSILLEPIIMVILAVIIGGLVIAMYLPIFKLGNIL